MSWLQEYRLRNLNVPSLELPERYKDANVYQIGQASFKQAAIKYLNGFYEFADKGIGMLLIGRSRTWKTYTAAAVCRGVHQVPLEVNFVSCADELLELSRDQFSPRTKRRLDEIKSVPFVVMDDFAMIPPGGIGHQMLLGIAEARFGAMLPTIWTGNIGARQGEVIEELTQSYGPGFARRVYDCSEGFRIRVT